MADEQAKWAPDGEPIDIGHGVSIKFCEYKGDVCAIREAHAKPDGSPCGGFAPFRGGSWDREFNGQIESWEVVKREPLTLAPSLLCRRCGHHGFIREGKWVPA